MNLHFSASRTWADARFTPGAGGLACTVLLLTLLALA